MANEESSVEPTSPKPRATKEEWGVAWDAFNASRQRLHALAVRDEISITLSAQRFGIARRKKKRR